MQYRKEIDGLRALAVVPVILFHAGIAGFSGGFVGVDIFFVISGYLITSIIIHELDSGTFSIAGFYERRARRILPALFFVILLSLPFAWWLLLPHELVAFGRSIIAVMLFASNILFWQESDYFATDSELIPLLHTWSLAVEEQYYLIFPVLLLLCWRLGVRRIAVIIGVIALLSLGIAEWGWRHDAAGNFYLLFGRAWELMAGAGCALYLYQQRAFVTADNTHKTGQSAHPHTIFSEGAAQWLSLLGLLLLIVAVLWLDNSVPFPSLYALLPVVGTALLILFARPTNWTGKLLALPPLVGIGLVSYSAYLWHQPMFAFARLYYADDPGLVMMLGLGSLAFVFAFISWRFVERPFRQRTNFTRQQIFTMALAASIAFILLAILFIVLDGLPTRFS